MDQRLVKSQQLLLFVDCSFPVERETERGFPLFFSPCHGHDLRQAVSPQQWWADWNDPTTRKKKQRDAARRSLPKPRHAGGAMLAAKDEWGLAVSVSDAPGGGKVVFAERRSQTIS